MTAFDPDWTVAPGEILADELEERSITTAEFAAQLSWELADLEAVLAGTAPITAERAADLSRVLGTSARVWLSLQVSFERGLAAGKHWDDPQAPTLPAH